MSIRTMKLPILFKNETEKAAVGNLIRNFNNIARFTYNRYRENPKLTTKEMTVLQKQMNNVILDAHFLNSAQSVTKGMKDEESVVFGGRKLFKERCQGKIPREEFLEKRLIPLCSVGEACQKANRKFRIPGQSHILFQPDKEHHYVLTLPRLRKNYKRDILHLLELQEQKACPITYKLSAAHIYLSFEDMYLEKQEIRAVDNRVFSVDLNPDYIGWAAVDWTDSDTYRLIDSGVVSNKGFTDRGNAMHKKSGDPERISLNNKRSFENIDTVVRLIGTAVHYGCQLFGIEELDMKTSDKKKGTKYNRLVNNQWDRDKVTNLFHKYCGRNGIRFVPVKAAYSSFEGNLVYRHLRIPDMCLAAVEIGRRAFEFCHQYIVQDKPHEKNIVFHMSETSFGRMRQSLEELSCDARFTTVKGLYKQLKTRKLKYRVPLDGCTSAVCSKKSIKSGVLLYSF